MIKIFKGLLILFLFSIPFVLKAQGEAGVPFLLLDVSPNLTGMAGTAVALPTNDVYGTWYNPAQLGNFSRTQNFGLGFYPANTDWLPTFNFSDLKWNSSAIAFGYTFNPNFPVHVGLSYTYLKLDLGENAWQDDMGNLLGTFNSVESSNALSVGAGIDYYAQINFGLTYKYIKSELVPSYIHVGSEVRTANATVSAFDLGLLMNYPVLNLFELNNVNKFFRYFTPFLDLSIGYTLQNFGNEITYLQEDQADPLPRQSKLGYGISLGFNHEFEGNRINIIKINFSSEARDLLIVRKTNIISDSVATGSNFEYENFMGDINIMDNIILGKADENVANYNGWRIKIFDTFQYSKGYINYYKKRGYSGVKSTSGFLISSLGPLKWISSNSTNDNLKYFSNHFSLEYAWSKYEADNSYIDDTEFQGIQINMFGYW